jgi:hypothetical protein
VSEGTAAGVPSEAGAGDRPGLAGHPPDLPAAYYLPVGDDRYAATEATTSPWDDTAQHGGPPTALLAACIDEAVGRVDVRLARISLDFLGPMPRAEVRVAVEVLRPGRRTQLTEAVMWAGSRKVAVARAWHLAVAPIDTGGRDDADGDAGTGKGAGVPPRPDAQSQSFFDGDTTWGYGRATEWRTVSGGFGAVSGAAQIWTRVRIPLVVGRPLDGLTRLLIVADSANGVSAPYSLSEWLFIPPGVTVHIHRVPVGEWVLLQARSDPGVDGIGLTEGTLSDRTGRCATVTQPLLVARR